MRLELTDNLMNTIIVGMVVFGYIVVSDYGFNTFREQQRMVHKEKLIQREINRTCPKFTCPEVKPCTIPEVDKK